MLGRQSASGILQVDDDDHMTEDSYCQLSCAVLRSITGEETQRDSVPMQVTVSLVNGANLRLCAPLATDHANTAETYLNYIFKYTKYQTFNIKTKNLPLLS